MKAVWKLVVVLACASVVWAAQSNLQSEPTGISVEQQKAIEKAVLQVHAQMMQADKDRDTDKFFAPILDSDKGPILQDGTLFKTRQEALDMVRAGYAQTVKMERTYDQTYVTVLSPQTAILAATGTSSATLTDGRVVGAPFAVSMVFVLRDGQWKVAQGHFSSPNQR